MRINKIHFIPSSILTIVLIFSFFSLITLYSAAGGAIHPWAFKQFLKLLLSFSLMFLITTFPVRIFYEWAYNLYFLSLILLIFVELSGIVGMGAQRWLNFYIFTVQPSEIMRVCLILALARYFFDNFYQLQYSKTLIIPFIMVIVPTLLIAHQPDLGTALIILGTSVLTAFCVGIQRWKFAAGFIGFCLSLPILWSLLHEYQKKRILIFLNPELDPKKSGYHILQSKIALGSGGIWGKGFLKGTQTQLHFLPEKQTDFIFTMFGEEFGLLGATVLIILYFILIAYNIRTAIAQKDLFSSFVITGLTSALFLYVFINMGMVMGLVPVVGVPLPFMSFGGNSLISLFISQGIIFSIAAQQKMRLAPKQQLSKY